MNLISNPSAELIHAFAVFARGRNDLYTSASLDFFVTKFSESGMCFVYGTGGGTILSLMSFACYNSETHRVFNILTTQVLACLDRYGRMLACLDAC
eukprot:4017174-Prymnesium_polylepis.2